MNILVTGSNGQLGNELYKISVDYPAYRFFFTDVSELDITDLDAVISFFELNTIHAVINCAAYTAVDMAESDESTAIRINATAVGYLAQACDRVKATLIHIYTDYVYDGCACKPYGEKAALSIPNSVVIRTSWLYSSFGNNFVKTMIRLGKERDMLNVIFDQVGTPTYAADLAQAIMVIAGRAEQHTLQQGVFHYSNEGVCSWYDFACEIMQQACLNCAVKPIETKDYPSIAPRPHYSVLNKALIKAVYGVEIPYWKNSLLKCFADITKLLPEATGMPSTHR